MAIDATTSSTIDTTVADTRAFDLKMLAANQAISRSTALRELGTAAARSQEEGSKAMSSHVAMAARSN